MILIAGPCVIESKDILKESVEMLLERINDKNIDFYFKSSFRKDNRTKFSSFSGLPEDEALSYLKDVKDEYGVKICTDFHNEDHLNYSDTYDVDIIQIPAFLAKQKSLLEPASNKVESTGKKLFIKKPQFVGPVEMGDIIVNTGIDDVWVGDRGTQMGYNQYFMDPRHVPIMKNFGATIIADITHPNKNYPGNLTENIKTLGLSYLAAGANGIFLETHPDCQGALCDHETMLDLDKTSIIDDFYSIYQSVNKSKE